MLFGLARRQHDTSRKYHCLAWLLYGWLRMASKPTALAFRMSAAKLSSSGCLPSFIMSERRHERRALLVSATASAIGVFQWMKTSSLTDDGGCGLRRERPQHRAPPELLTLLVIAVLQQLEDTERLEPLAFLHQPARPVLRTSAFFRPSLIKWIPNHFAFAQAERHCVHLKRLRRGESAQALSTYRVADVQQEVRVHSRDAEGAVVSIVLVHVVVVPRVR